MVIGIAVIPYIYQHIGIERIGVLTIIWALIGYFSIFDFGLGRAITQRIASLSSHQTDSQKKTIATTGVFLTLLVGMVGGLVGFAAIELVGVNWINSALHLESEIRASFLLACLTLSNIISPLMVVADRFLIANVLGAAVVAYYTIPAEFMIRLLVLPAALTTTLFPVFTKDLSEKNFASALVLYKKSMKIIFLIMGTITGSVFIGAGFGIDLWLGPEFAEKSATVTSVLGVGILFNSMAQVPHAYIQASGDARSTALIHLFESALYIPALFLLMQLHGILGAALAWMLRALLDLVLLHGRAMRLNT